MDRREFLESIAGISLSLAAAVHARARDSVAGLRTLSPAQDAALSCIAEILLPQTDTPGAAQVGVNRFIDLLLTESMLPRDRDRFLEGLAAIEARSRLRNGASIASATREEQESLIRSLDSQLPAWPPTKAERTALEAQPVTAERGYEVLKGLVVFAYFTSEPVAKGLINAPIIPGRYDGCVST